MIEVTQKPVSYMVTLIEAKIILKKRKECAERIARKGGCQGRCSVCPLFTTLDQYITARKVIETFEMERRQEYASL